MSDSESKNESKDPVRDIIEDAKKRAKETARFHVRAWKNNAEGAKRTGRRVLIDWLSEESKRLDARVEQLAWKLHRPVAWLTEKVNALDDKLQEKHQKAAQVKTEQVLQEDEIPRMDDEGGPPVASGSDVVGNKVVDAKAPPKTSNK